MIALSPDALFTPQCPNCGNYMREAGILTVMRRRIVDASAYLYTAIKVLMGIQGK